MLLSSNETDVTQCLPGHSHVCKSDHFSLFVLVELLLLCVSVPARVEQFPVTVHVAWTL